MNKVNSRVELRFDVAGSSSFSEGQRGKLQEELRNRLSANGELILSCDRSRSQQQNKQECLQRFQEILARALTPSKPRIATRPSSGVRRRRLENKRQVAEKKRLRQKIRY